MTKIKAIKEEIQNNAKVWTNPLECSNEVHTQEHTRVIKLYGRKILCRVFLFRNHDISTG